MKWLHQSSASSMNILCVATAAMLGFFGLAGCAGYAWGVRDGTTVTVIGTEHHARFDDGEVFVDGKPSAHRYDWIMRPGVALTNGGRHGYIANRDGHFYAVLDGREYGPYDAAPVERGVIFSANGTSAAWLAQRGGKWHVVVDGIEQPAYDGLSADIALSPDGSRSAYGASRNNRWILIADGVEQLEASSILAGFGFTASNELVASVGGSEGWTVHIDDWKSERFDLIIEPGLVFDPGRRNVSWIGKRDKSFFVGINRRVLGPYVLAGVPLILPPSILKRFAVSLAKEVAMGVAMGVAAAAYDGPYVDGMAVAQAQHSQMRGSPQGETEGETVVIPSTVYSPDGKHHAFVAYPGGTRKIVIDGSVAADIPGEAPLETLIFGSSSQAVLWKTAIDEQFHAIAVPGDARAAALDAGPETAVLKVTSTQPTTLVFVDDQFQGLAPIERRFTAGGHVVRSEAFGFASEQREVDVPGTGNAEVNFDLVPEGFLSIVRDVLSRHESSHMAKPPIPVLLANYSRVICKVPFNEIALAVITELSGELDPASLLVFTDRGLRLHGGTFSDPKAKGTHFVPYEEFMRSPNAKDHPFGGLEITPMTFLQNASSLGSKKALIALLEDLRAALLAGSSAARGA